MTLTEECSSRVLNKLPQKLKDSRTFILHMQIDESDVGQVLCDLRVSIN